LKTETARRIADFAPFFAGKAPNALPATPKTVWFPISSAQNLQISTGLISLWPECGNGVV
jgi:hypothetical protein